MTWMNLAYMVLGVVFWHITKMVGDVAFNLGRRARARRLMKIYRNQYGFMKIDLLTDESTIWLREFRAFWDEFGNAADKMWQPQLSVTRLNYDDGGWY